MTFVIARLQTPKPEAFLLTNLLQIFVSRRLSEAQLTGLWFMQVSCLVQIQAVSRLLIDSACEMGVRRHTWDTPVSVFSERMLKVSDC